MVESTHGVFLGLAGGGWPPRVPQGVERPKSREGPQARSSMQQRLGPDPRRCIFAISDNGGGLQVPGVFRVTGRCLGGILERFEGRQVH